MEIQAGQDPWPQGQDPVPAGERPAVILGRVTPPEHRRGPRPSGKRKDDCFFTTKLDARIEEILQTVSARWSLEVTFGSCRHEPGIEDQQNRVRPAVERAAPFGFLAYTLVVAWFATSGESRTEKYRVGAPWNRTKETPSFADTLEEFRRRITAGGVSASPLAGKDRRNNAV